MAQFPNIFNCDLHSGPVSASIRQMYLGDIAANRVGVRVTDNGEAVALSGTCSGTAMLYNGGTVALTGVVDGNVAYVDLPAAVYSVEGPLKVFVTLTHGGSTTTLLEMRSNVTRTESGVVIDPGTIIPSVAALISDIEDAVASIPEDYSELSADVVQLKSDMAEVKPEVETLGEDVSDLRGAVRSVLNNQYITMFRSASINGTRNVEVSANIPNGKYTINIGNITSTDTDTTKSLIMFSNGNTTVLQIEADRISNYTADITLNDDVNKITFFASTTYNLSKGDTFSFDNVSIINPDNQLNNRITNTEKCIPIIDKTLRTRNLFNLATYMEHKQFNGNGTISYSELTGISDFIPVESGKSIYFSTDGRPYKRWDISFICEYDETKTFIQRIDQIGVDYVYTVPVNVSYIRICILDSKANVWQCEYDGITGYVPYYLYNAIDYIEDGVLMVTVNMFGSIAGIGDSYTAGSSQSSGGTMVDMPNQSYIATMGKRAGVDWYNYGVGGATVGSYLVNANGLPKVLAANPRDLYIINLGQNDVNQVVTIGTIEDINDSDYTQNPDTFYGNYGKLMAQLKAHAPNAKIVLVKSWIDGKSWNHNIDYQSYDPAIQEIAEHYGVPCIAPFDDRLFRSYFYSHYKLNGHPTPMGYTAQGLAMERLFSKCVLDNPEYFIDATVN